MKKLKKLIRLVGLIFLIMLALSGVGMGAMIFPKPRQDEDDIIKTELVEGETSEVRGVE